MQMASIKNLVASLWDICIKPFSINSDKSIKNAIPHTIAFSIGFPPAPISSNLYRIAGKWRS